MSTDPDISPKNLTEARATIARLKSAGATKAPAIGTTTTGKPTVNVTKLNGAKGLLAAIDAAAKGHFLTSAQADAALANVVTIAGTLTAKDTEARGIAGLVLFIGRVSDVRETGRPFAALSAIRAISAYASSSK